MKNNSEISVELTFSALTNQWCEANQNSLHTTAISESQFMYLKQKIMKLYFQVLIYFIFYCKRSYRGLLMLRTASELFKEDGI